MADRRRYPVVACRGGGCTAAVDAARCKSGLCKRCYRRGWYLSHREHEQRTMATWRTENREHDRKRWADYFEANAERLRTESRRRYAADRAAALAMAAAYREANRELIRQRKRERRIADPNWAPRNRENVRQRRGDGPVNYAAILAEHGMTCHLCCRPIETRADLHMDHVVPLSRGGLHHPDNIRPAHAICNLRKGARVT